MYPSHPIRACIACLRRECAHADNVVLLTTFPVFRGIVACAHTMRCECHVRVHLFQAGNRTPHASRGRMACNHTTMP